MCHSNSVCTFPSRPVLFAAAIWVQLRWMRTKLTNNDRCSVPSLCSFIYAIFLSHGFQFQSECSSLKLTIDKLRFVFSFRLALCMTMAMAMGHGMTWSLQPFQRPATPMRPLPCRSANAMVGRQPRYCRGAAWGTGMTVGYLLKRSQVRRKAQVQTEEVRPEVAKDKNGGNGDEGDEEFLTNTKALDAQILSLALPALIALCAEPVLSIIDTGFVGRLPNAPLWSLEDWDSWWQEILNQIWKWKIDA